MMIDGSMIHKLIITGDISNTSNDEYSLRADYFDHART
jgi:hypothetical protein